MGIKVFSDLFKTTAIIEIDSIAKEMDIYCKDVDDFAIGVIRYFQYLNAEYNLDFSPEEEIEIPKYLLSKFLIERKLTKKSTVWIIAQFIYTVIFNYHLPNTKRNDNTIIYYYLSKIDDLIYKGKSENEPNTRRLKSISNLREKFPDSYIAPSRSITHPEETKRLNESKIFGMSNLQLFVFGAIVNMGILFFQKEVGDFGMWIGAFGGLIALLGVIRFIFNIN